MTHLAIPSPNYLRERVHVDHGKVPPAELTKHEKAYEAFCQWSALPKEMRIPSTIKAFEKRWKLPKTYTRYFKERKDYQDKRLSYFWEWMMDNFPDVVYAVYKNALKGNAVHSKAFIELIAKNISIDKQVPTLQPLMLIGVAQDKIDKLLIPRGYEQVDDILPRSQT